MNETGIGNFGIEEPQIIEIGKPLHVVETRIGDPGAPEPLCWSSDFCAAHVLLKTPSDLLFGAEI